MGALRVAFESRESSNGVMERVKVLGSGQGVNFVERLNLFNLDLAETVIHRLHQRLIGCGAIVGGPGIDRSRGQAVAKRIHSRPRFAFLAAWAAAFCAVPLVRSYLPLRCHDTTF
jgi:hypothetical protein